MNVWLFVVDYVLPAFAHKLGWLSALIGIVGATAIFPAAERVRDGGDRRTPWLWLSGGALAMGFAFWNMQRMAMLDVGLPVPPMLLSSPVFLFSMLPVILASAIAIWLIAQPSKLWFGAPVGACVLFVGMVCMQLLTMDGLVEHVSMPTPEDHRALSAVVGVVFILFAMYVNKRVTRDSSGTLMGRLFGSVALGLAVANMHYSSLEASLSRIPTISALDAMPAPFLIPAILASVLIVVGGLWFANLIDKRLASAVALSHETRAVFSSLISVLPDGVVICGADGRVRTGNPAAEIMFGYTSGEMIGLDVGELMRINTGERCAPETPQESEAFMSRVSGQRQVYAEGGQRRDGTVFPVEIAFHNMRVQGESALACIVRDMTHDWESSRRTQRLAAAVDGAEEAIALMNEKGKIEYVNRAYEKMTGYSIKDVQGYVPGRGKADDNTYKVMWDAVHGPTKLFRGKLPRQRRDGTSFTEEFTLTRVADEDGKTLSFVEIARDVSEREERDRERDRMMAALHNAADAIEILDPEGRILYVNPVSEQSTGRTLADLKGQPADVVREFLPEDAAVHAALMREIKAGKSWQGLLRSRIKSNNSVRAEDVSVSPVRDALGNLESFVVVRRDVTARLELEQELAQARKLESLGQLAAGIAHEINTPTQYVSDNIRFVAESFGGLNELLASLRAFVAAHPGPDTAALAAQIVSADIDFLCEEVPRALAQSDEGCARIATIVRAMKEFSHPGQGKAAVDLNRAIGSTITVASNEWKYVAEIKTELDAGLPMVPCVLGELNQVVLNLLVNAAHAIGDVVADGGKGTITVTTRHECEWAEIRIADTGTGIRAEIRDKIFDPFFTTKAVGKGTGQGLAIAYDVVVNRHGGSMKVESEVGVGSTFIIRLPLQTEPVELFATA